MIKQSKINAYNEVRLVDTFKPVVMSTNEDGSPKVNIHFGQNMDILVITAKDKQLSKDNQERIRILTDQRQ